MHYLTVCFEIIIKSKIIINHKAVWVKKTHFQALLSLLKNELFVVCGLITWLLIYVSVIE